MSRVSIGLVGDYDAGVPAHRAIPLALVHAAESLGIEARCSWLSTAEITSVPGVAGFDGLWCVPASPYWSMQGALTAIRHAREHRIPFLGTCGGFQHAVIEYARNVLGWADAEHAETAPEAQRPVIAPLECALLEVTAAVDLMPGSRIAAAYAAVATEATYRCRFGINPAFRKALTGGPLRVSAIDAAGDVRAVELDGHPFFVATLFQPERAALRGAPVPLAAAFVAACAATRQGFAGRM